MKRINEVINEFSFEAIDGCDISSNDVQQCEGIEIPHEAWNGLYFLIEDMYMKNRFVQYVAPEVVMLYFGRI